MTKINKLGKSTFVIAILSFLLVAVLAFGGTYAYFSAQSKTATGSIDLGNLTVGEVTGDAISSNAITFDTTVAQPNQQILTNEAISVTVTSNIAYYTRVKFDVEVTPEVGHEHLAETPDDCNDYFATAIEALTVTTTNAGWDQNGEYFYKLAPTAHDSGDKTEEFVVSIQAKPILGNFDGTANGCTYWQDATITISISFEVIQADYLVNGATTGAKFDNATLAAAAWTTALTGAQSGS